MVTRSLNAVVVIPTLNAAPLLERCLASLDAQEREVEVVVVDNASVDGTAAWLRDRYPGAALVRNDCNLGFGNAVNAGVAGARSKPDVVILVNNDTELLPGFVEAILAPFADPGVGMVAGVLLRGDAPDRIDSAGIELDRTLRSADMLANAPVAALATARDPVGPCGGAAAYRAAAFAEVEGFDPSFFAYWEDVDLALRLRLAGWTCRLAPTARVVHRHGATLGASSPAARRLEAFGRGFVIERYGVARRSLRDRLAVAAIDWPALAVHLVARRELGPIRARLRGRRAAARSPRLRAPVELATVSVGTTLARQWHFLADRLRGRAPRHFYESTGVGSER
jgi:N-acetylglucosaminyl-diphospho-decaprenol L-rhamnosyltransferase